MIFFAETGLFAALIRTTIKNVPMKTANIDERMTDVIAHLSFNLRQPYVAANCQFVLFYSIKIQLFFKEIKNGYDLESYPKIAKID